MRVFALIFLALASFAQVREGNFGIRFEPQVVLQANAAIPFEIQIKDDLHRPLTEAKVTLQIETQQQHTQVAVFKATATAPGTYIAKPLFPAGGAWSVYVEVRRDGEMSARTIDFNVPDSTGP